MEMERLIMGYGKISYLFASIAQNWFKEFMTGMEKNLVEPEGKKMLKVNISMIINEKYFGQSFNHIDFFQLRI